MQSCTYTSSFTFLSHTIAWIEIFCETHSMSQSEGNNLILLQIGLPAAQSAKVSAALQVPGK